MLSVALIVLFIAIGSVSAVSICDSLFKLTHAWRKARLDLEQAQLAPSYVNEGSVVTLQRASADCVLAVSSPLAAAA